MTEVVDNNMFTHIVGWREIEEEKEKSRRNCGRAEF